MKIEKIEIENFRGYKGKHTLEFDSHINVFVGVNGAGKSSILDLIAMFIDALLKDVHNDFLGYEDQQPPGRGDGRGGRVESEWVEELVATDWTNTEF